MAMDLSNNPTYTDAEILKHLRRCFVDSAYAEQWRWGEEAVSRMPADKILGLIESFEARIAQAAVSDGGGMNAMIQFNERH